MEIYFEIHSAWEPLYRLPPVPLPFRGDKGVAGITTSLAPLKGELAGRKARLRGSFDMFAGNLISVFFI